MKFEGITTQVLSGLNSIDINLSAFNYCTYNYYMYISKTTRYPNDILTKLRQTGPLGNIYHADTVCEVIVKHSLSTVYSKS